MDANARACVAYIAATIINGRRRSSIYDYAQSRHFSISGTVTPERANVYDYDRGCHFGGTLPSLFDYGRSAHVNLKIDGSKFKGFDYGDSHHFTGTVRGNSVSIYDYGQSQYFNYGV